MNLSQELPITNSMNNIWGEWNCTEKGKYLLKIHSPPISMGNHISQCLPKLLRVAILSWTPSHKQRWGPKLSKSFPFTGQQSVSKVLHDFQSLRTLLGPVLFFQATEVSKIHHYMNSKDTSMPLKNTEENTKNVNPVNGLTDLQNTLPMSNRQLRIIES